MPAWYARVAMNLDSGFTLAFQQPWLLSNVKGSLDEKFPSKAPYVQHLVIERPGVRIGLIGLMDLWVIGIILFCPCAHSA